MKRLKDWLRAKKDAVKNSKGFFGIILLAIGISFTICFYEGRALYLDYQEAMGYLESRKAIHIINEAEAKAEPVEVKKDDGLEEVVKKIQMLESSGGKNDEKCHRIGGHNSYGYGQGNGRNFCLDSDDAVKEVVKDWFRDKLKVYSLEESICLYNLGLAVGECKYLADFKSL